MLTFIPLLEGKANDIAINPLKFTRKDVKPVMSDETLDLHYNKLAKGYAKRYNDRIGDRDFNYAGVFLHNCWFDQFRESRVINKPNGPIANFIEKHYGTYGEFQTKFEETAMKIQGSGWVYLSTAGDIKTIANHAVRTDICVLVDWWEHVWATDYQWDKERYLDNIWKIIDWDVCNERL